MAVWPKNYKKFFEKKNRPLKYQRTIIQIRCNLSDLSEACLEWQYKDYCNHNSKVSVYC